MYTPVFCNALGKYSWDLDSPGWLLSGPRVVKTFQRTEFEAKHHLAAPGSYDWIDGSKPSLLRIVPDSNWSHRQMIRRAGLLSLCEEDVAQLIAHRKFVCHLPDSVRSLHVLLHTLKNGCREEQRRGGRQEQDGSLGQLRSSSGISSWRPRDVSSIIFKCSTTHYYASSFETPNSQELQISGDIRQPWKQ